MKTSKEKLEENGWRICDESIQDIYYEKFIDDELVICQFREKISEIILVETSSRYLTPEFIEELNKKLKKLDVKENEQNEKDYD